MLPPQSGWTDEPSMHQTAYGLTDPILVSGVTKQGGPLSPLKSTLTTSLGHRWLHDLASRLSGALVVSSYQARLHLPHIPTDSLRLPVTMVEAMDGSPIFATTLFSLHTLVFSAERFQAAYCWLTSWPKSLLLMLNVRDPPASTLVPSVDPADVTSPLVVSQPVTVVTNHMEFLRVVTNDPRQQFRRLRDIVDSFDFPHLYRRLPLTLLRRLIVQRLISRIRPRLAFQPLLRAHAVSLDTAIAHKVHQYLRFPFAFSSTLITLPLSLHCFAFPSVARLNDCAAVTGLLHDLNRHVPLFSHMARITLADWTCSAAHLPRHWLPTLRALIGHTLASLTNFLSPGSLHIVSCGTLASPSLTLTFPSSSPVRSP